ncbi:hypothetical protein L1049_021102 [Liquidambar formosana]|uniref:Uncharacterized protein n=1 Tax=Liquidambar formosana TaxID=63359 RepID=A0AAP0SE34_LIQFO
MVPDYPEKHLGFGLKVDYGRYHASKMFYDPNKMRRINWGYVVEADDKEKDHVNKGWAGRIQSIPRVVDFDQKTRNNKLQWPVEWLSSTEFDGVEVGPGKRVPFDIGTATEQLDISAEFEIDKEALEENVDEHVNYDCWGGAVVRGSFGPFGLLVNAHPSFSELTLIYFHIAKATGGTLKTFVCTDKSRSSKASSVDKQIYGAEVPLLYDENLSMRLLINHSVVESFA